MCLSLSAYQTIRIFHVRKRIEIIQSHQLHTQIEDIHMLLFIKKSEHVWVALYISISSFIAILKVLSAI